MKNVRPVGVLPAIAFALPYFAGCSRFTPLTHDDSDVIDQAINYAHAETQLVQSMAEAADHNTVFDSSGNTGAKAFQDDLDITVALLDEYYKQDKIVCYTGEAPDKTHARAFWAHPFFAEDVIAVNCDALYTYPGISGGDLLHEVGHILYGGHDPALASLQKGQGSNVSFNAANAEAIITVQDYPYLLSFNYNASDKALDDPYSSVTSTVESLEGQIENENAAPEEIYQQIMLFYCPEQERWIERTTDDTFTNTHYLPTFAIRKTEFSTALPSSGVYQFQQDVFKEPLTQFMKDYLGDGYTLTCPE